MVQKAYEFRLYPTDEQKLQIGKTIGSSRYVYNGFLTQRKELYATEKLSLTYNQCSAILTPMKQDDETRWLKEVDKFALQNSLKDLDKACFEILLSTKRVGTVEPTLRLIPFFHRPSFVASVVRRTEC